MSSSHSDDTPAPPSERDRRTEERHAAAVVTMLEIEGTERSALLRDLSVTGAMCLSRARPDAGTRLRLHLCVDGDRETALILDGEVVRSAPWQDGGSYWPFSIAIRLDNSAAAHIERIREIGDRQASQGLLPTRA